MCEQTREINYDYENFLTSQEMFKTDTNVTLLQMKLTLC